MLRAHAWQRKSLDNTHGNPFAYVYLGVVEEVTSFSNYQEVWILTNLQGQIVSAYPIIGNPHPLIKYFTIKGRRVPKTQFAWFINWWDWGSFPQG